MLSKEEIEKYKTECELLDFTNKEIVDEAIATLIDAMDRKSDGFRRVEKVALVAICTLSNRVYQLETREQNLIEYIEKKLGEYDETIIEIVLQNILAVAKGEKSKW